MNSKGNMTDIASILHSSFKELKLDVILREHNILKIWDEVVGERISKKAQPYRIIGSTLYVKVSSSPWMQELNYLKGQVITKLNERLKEKKVDNIIFKLGRGSKLKSRASGRKPPWLKVNICKEDKNSIQKMVAHLKDPELKEVLSQVLSLEKRLNLFKVKTNRN